MSRLVIDFVAPGPVKSMGWVGLQPHPAQLETGVGGATASPGPGRDWGGHQHTHSGER